MKMATFVLVLAGTTHLCAQSEAPAPAPPVEKRSPTEEAPADAKSGPTQGRQEVTPPQNIPDASGPERKGTPGQPSERPSVHVEPPAGQSDAKVSPSESLLATDAQRQGDSTVQIITERVETSTSESNKVWNLFGLKLLHSEMPGFQEPDPLEIREINLIRRPATDSPRGLTLFSIGFGRPKAEPKPLNDD